MLDIIRDQQSAIGQVTGNELEYLKTKLFEHLQNSNILEDAIMSLMSEPKYLDNIPEAEEIGTGDLEAVLEQGYQLLMEPASRLLYTEQDGQLLFWANGEAVCISEASASYLKRLADGELIILDENLADNDILEDIAHLLNESIIMLAPTDDAE